MCWAFHITKITISLEFGFSGMFEMIFTGKDIHDLRQHLML